MKTARTRKRIEKIARVIMAIGDAAIDFDDFTRIMSNHGYVISNSSHVFMNGKNGIRYQVMPEYGDDDKEVFMAMARDVQNNARIREWIIPLYTSYGATNGEPLGSITILH